MILCITFIPTICTHSTAVPVALDRNSAMVSSAIARRLHEEKQHLSKLAKIKHMLPEKGDWALHLPSWVVRIPLRTRHNGVLLLMVLTTRHHGVAARVRGGRRSLKKIVRRCYQKNNNMTIH
jgi:hypothetical protein